MFHFKLLTHCSRAVMLLRFTLSSQATCESSKKNKDLLFLNVHIHTVVGSSLQLIALVTSDVN